ncbi:collagen alpha-1(I) chain-like, partial [Gracilinanus agilis]|uniref:collagen alpha-1(I) chain-like n=1 Tax=Gracilinanus agilis TaxID=191870 RepID=UPI001CFDB075
RDPDDRRRGNGRPGPPTAEEGTPATTPGVPSPFRHILPTPARAAAGARPRQGGGIVVKPFEQHSSLARKPPPRGESARARAADGVRDAAGVPAGPSGDGRKPARTPPGRPRPPRASDPGPGNDAALRLPPSDGRPPATPPGPSTPGEGTAGHPHGRGNHTPLAPLSLRGPVCVGGVNRRSLASRRDSRAREAGKTGRDPTGAPGPRHKARGPATPPSAPETQGRARKPDRDPTPRWSLFRRGAKAGLQGGRLPLAEPLPSRGSPSLALEPGFPPGGSRALSWPKPTPERRRRGRTSRDRAGGGEAEGGEGGRGPAPTHTTTTPLRAAPAPSRGRSQPPKEGGAGGRAAIGRGEGKRRGARGAGGPPPHTPPQRHPGPARIKEPAAGAAGAHTRNRDRARLSLSLPRPSRKIRPADLRGRTRPDAARRRGTPRCVRERSGSLLDSQVRPSSQRSARAVGRPRRGRSEDLTKPSNRHGKYHRKLIGQTFEWVIAATGGVRSARGYLESPKRPGHPRPCPGTGTDGGKDRPPARHPPPLDVTHTDAATDPFALRKPAGPREARTTPGGPPTLPARETTGQRKGIISVPRRGGTLLTRPTDGGEEAPRAPQPPRRNDSGEAVWERKARERERGGRAGPRGRGLGKPRKRSSTAPHPPPSRGDRGPLEKSDGSEDGRNRAHPRLRAREQQEDEPTPARAGGEEAERGGRTPNEVADARGRGTAEERAGPTRVRRAGGSSGTGQAQSTSPLTLSSPAGDRWPHDSQGRRRGEGKGAKPQPQATRARSTPGGDTPYADRTGGSRERGTGARRGQDPHERGGGRPAENSEQRHTRDPRPTRPERASCSRFPHTVTRGESTGLLLRHPRAERGTREPTARRSRATKGSPVQALPREGIAGRRAARRGGSQEQAGERQSKSSSPARRPSLAGPGTPHRSEEKFPETGKGGRGKAAQRAPNGPEEKRGPGAERRPGITRGPTPKRRRGESGRRAGGNPEAPRGPRQHRFHQPREVPEKNRDRSGRDTDRQPETTADRLTARQRPQGFGVCTPPWQSRPHRTSGLRRINEKTQRYRFKRRWASGDRPQQAPRGRATRGESRKGALQNRLSHKAARD